jgi:hypothetical protein
VLELNVEVVGESQIAASLSYRLRATGTQRRRRCASMLTLPLRPTAAAEALFATGATVHGLRATGTDS